MDKHIVEERFVKEIHSNRVALALLDGFLLGVDVFLALNPQIVAMLTK